MQSYFVCATQLRIIEVNREDKGAKEAVFSFPISIAKSPLPAKHKLICTTTLDQSNHNKTKQQTKQNQPPPNLFRLNTFAHRSMFRLHVRSLNCCHVNRI